MMLLAAAASPPSSPTPTGNGPALFNFFQGPFFLPVLAIAVLFMFMGRGKSKDEKQRQEMLKQLKRGDRIQTIGGIQGAVVRAEESRVEVKVDESSNTKIWFARTAIARVIEAGKAEK
jgi:preprotein translocase subunit YajC